MPEKPASTFNAIEQEVIVLLAVWNMIGEMVNYLLFVKGDATEDVQLRFNSTVHQRLFSILLVDVLSRQTPSRSNGMPFNLAVPPENADQVSYTYLYYLRRIARSPGLTGDASGLNEAVDKFWEWLDGESVVEKAWFPEIDLETDVKAKRISYLKICGNINKHNSSRLQENVGKIRGILRANGRDIDEQQGYQAIESFNTWFYDNVFSYHASTIAEFLNEIRWTIYEYLCPVFRECFRQKAGEMAYSYVMPPEIEQPLARAMFWDLMNAVRTPPYFRRFKAIELLKLRY